MTSRPDPALVRAALRDVGENVGDALRIEPMALGASRECWWIVDGASRYVLKRDPPDEPSPATSREQEYAVVSAAASAGVPVARPVCVEPAGGRFGTAGFVTAGLVGTSSPRKVHALGEQAHATLLRDLGRALAVLHRAGTVAPVLSSRSSDPVTAELVELAQDVEELAADRPAFAMALMWARTHRPARRPAVLVHGDFRLGNVMVADDGGLVGLIDWEFARAGDMAADIGFFCLRPWRFGRDRLAAGGLGPRTALLDAYAAQADLPIDEQDVRFAEVLGQLRWGLYCLRQAVGYRRGEHASLERLVLGRRATAAEWDLLDLIGA